ncbi:hypothetical protein [Nitrosomonas sp. ANs5]|uniref:hypothetical protein n=1 Tax=Nitrosomonas sp. ANs5 TaxID=3423941 RepID=UPI003D34F079
MAKQTRTASNPQSNTNIPQQGTTSPERALDDQLAAEAEYQDSMTESQEFPSDMEIQQSGVHGPRKDDRLKKIVKQHPKKAIPQIESMEPEQAPFKE